MTAVSYILYFILLIGVLVFIHEGGHFVMAKLFKVKVHTFSLGFGPKLLGFRKGETLYKISAVPIGGYVKMLGEDPTEKIQAEDRGRAFTDKPLWQRFFIIIGGPAMNLIFPLILHFCVGLTMTDVLPSEVGFVIPNSPAAVAGLRAGDRIVSIEDSDVDTFDEMVAIVAPNPEATLRFKIDRDGEILVRDIAPEAVEVTVVLSEKETIGRIGVGRSYLASVVGVPDIDSPGAQAGLETFDMIVAVNEQEVKRLKDLESMIVGAAGKTVTLSIRRMRDDFSPKSPQPYDEKAAPLKITLPIPSRASSLKDVGLTGCTDFVAYVDPKGAASEIGLERGDRLISYGGRSLELGQVSSAVYKKPNEAEVLEWSRKAQRMTGSFKSRFIPAGQAKDLGIAQDAYDKGFEIYAETDLMKKISNPSLISSAWRYSKDETWAGIRMIGIGFKLLFRGEVSMRSIGGPIMIGQLAGMAGEQGPSSFFWMMALISLNLGLINLLPIPVLDGGQLIFIAVEGIIRRPVSLRIKERVMVVGLAMIVMLMLFATWNDISRLIVG